MSNPDEQHAIHHLMARGRAFTIGFFKDANVTEETIAKLYYGQPVDNESLRRIKKLLKERMSEDAPRVGINTAGCPTCGAAFQERVK